MYRGEWLGDSCKDDEGNFFVDHFRPEDASRRNAIRPPVSVYHLYTTLRNQNKLPNSGSTRWLIWDQCLGGEAKPGAEYFPLTYFGNHGNNEVTIKISTNKYEETMETNDEFTRERFLAVLHIHNFLSKFHHSSALVKRIDFTEADWKEEHKTMFEDLFGNGFQFQGKFIMEDLKLKNKKERDEAVRIWWALCYVMDYLALTIWLQRRADEARTESLPEFSIFDYIKDKEYFKRAVPEIFQGVVDEAERNVGVEGRAIVQACSFSDIADVVKKLIIDRWVKNLSTAIDKILILRLEAILREADAAESRSSGTQREAEAAESRSSGTPCCCCCNIL